MLADVLVTCDPTLQLDNVCRSISSHDPTGLAGPLVQRLLGAIAVFAIVYLVGRLLRRGLLRAVERAGGDPQLVALVRNVGTMVIYFFAVLCGLVSAGIPLAFLLTFGGLTSLAIGLAFQDLLRNILAGIWLLVERPFRIGDQVSVGDQAGVVQTITLRTTALRTGDGRLAILPNLTVFTGNVINSSAFQHRRYTVTVRVDRDHDLQTCMRAARHELEATAGVDEFPAPAVRPQLDGEEMLLHCDYWLDQRAHDSDALTAEIARRLWMVTDGAHGTGVEAGRGAAS